MPQEHPRSSAIFSLFFDAKAETMKKNILYLGIAGEMFQVDLEQVVYMQADDHYTHIYYSNGLHFVVPFGLSRMEKAVRSQMGDANAFRRVGRSYIVHLDKVFHINVPRQCLQYFDAKGCPQTLNLPKALLQGLMEHIRTRHPGTVLTPSTEFDE